MKKILLPNDTNKSQIILDSTDFNMPEGYRQYWLSDTQWTLIDALGRINISWIYQWALQQDVGITDKRPSTWLRNKTTKVLRSNYQTILGFDPVETVKPEDAVYLTGRENSPCLQTTGTYMTDRMFISYAAWVSFEFKRYVDDIFLSTANDPLSPNGLILSTDQLHQENNAINSRHRQLISDILSVPTHLASPNIHLREVQDYVEWLRVDFNIDITVVGYLKWLCHIGIFYRGDFLLGGDSISMYRPKSDYVGNLFFTSVSNQTGIELVKINVSEQGHNALIQQITTYFGLILND